jgi:FixJ family two-component response regulator
VICAITGKPLSEVLAVIKDNREHFARDLERHRCDPALVQLPDLSGLEFVSQLRSRGSQVPTIMITATTDPALERRAAELGIKQVLQKPLSNQVLLRAVRKEME